MPGEAAALPSAGVIYFSAEDSAAHTLRPRIEAAGGDLSRVLVIDDEGRLPRLPDDASEIERLIEEHGAALVVFDTLFDFLARSTDSHKTQDVRLALNPVVQVCRRTGATVLFLRHLTKATGPAITRGVGSGAITGIARVVHLVGVDPSDPTARVIAKVKNNLAGQGLPSLRFRVEGDKSVPPRVVWLGPSQTTADQLLAHVEVSASPKPRDFAMDFLRRSLRGRPLAKSEVMELAIAERIRQSALRRASEDLGVVKRKSSEANGPWLWSLPGEDVHSSGMSAFTRPGEAASARTAPSAPNVHGPEGAHTEDAHPGVSTFDARSDHDEWVDALNAEYDSGAATRGWRGEV